MRALQRQVASIHALVHRKSAGPGKWQQRSLLRSSVFAWMLCAVAMGVQAQELMAMLAYSRMNNPERVEAGLKSYGDRVYRLQPAKTIQPLPQAAWAPSLESEAKSYANNRHATVVLEGGRLVFESYRKGVNPDTLHHGFSVVKALTALAVGEALCAGHIKNLDDLAQAYVPAVKDTSFGKTTLRNLLGYTSAAKDPGGNGYIGTHSYRDFGAMLLGSISLQDLLIKHGGHEGKFKPGEQFIYNGLDSEMLGLVIRAATGMSLPAWFEATVWQEAGAEFAAAWVVDRDGNGVAEGKAFISARDYARLGLYLQERLNDQTGSACIRDFLKEASQARTTRGKEYWRGFPAYGLGFHLAADSSVWMLGHDGQLVGVNPNNQRVLITVNDNYSPRTNDAIGILSRPATPPN